MSPEHMKVDKKYLLDKEVVICTREAFTFFNDNHKCNCRRVEYDILFDDGSLISSYIEYNTDIKDNGFIDEVFPLD